MWRRAAIPGSAGWRIKRNSVIPAEETLPDGSRLSHAFPSDRCRRKAHPGVPVRVIDCELDDPGRPSAEPPYPLGTTILAPDEAPRRTNWQSSTPTLGGSRAESFTVIGAIAGG